MKALRRWTIGVHRYLGLGLAAVFVLWFLSGIAMVFTGGMPELTERARRDRLPVLDFSRVAIAPGDVPGGHRDLLVLTSVTGRPAYRISPGRVIFADDGADATPSAMALGADFLGVRPSALRDVGLLTTPDQWTLTERRRLPLRKLVVDDSDGTELYISERDAEVVLMTTRRTRVLAWLSAIPHWFYFAPLRAHAALWRQVVLWVSAAGAVLALAGLALAALQFRPRRPVRISHVATWHPYSGWLRWHYLLGAVCGVFALTWVASGWLSMQPADWAAPAIDAGRIQRALNGVDGGFNGLGVPGASAWRRAIGSDDVREIAFVRRLGDIYLEIRGAAGRARLVDAASLRERHAVFPVDALVDAVRQGTGGMAVVDVTVLQEYDSYYYSRKDGRPLPVARVKLADPEDTWVYVDPARGDVVGVYSYFGRVERWLYHGLHSLDVPFLNRRPSLWRVIVITLCAGGAALSTTGMVAGVRRLLRRRSRFR